MILKVSREQNILMSFEILIRIPADEILKFRPLYIYIYI